MSFLQSHSKFSSRFILTLYFYCSFVLFALIAVLLAMPDELATTILREGGVVETLSALGYLLILVYVFITFNKSFLVKYHYLMILLLMFAMRELDFDKRFTEVGILKSRFLLSVQVPVLEKIIGAFVLVLLVYVVWMALYRHFIPIMKAIVQPKAYMLGVYLGVLVMVVSKTLDGLQRKLEGFGIYTTNWLVQNASLIEEALELFIPVYFFLAFWFYKQEKSNVDNLKLSDR